MKNLFNSESGFSLLELIIVVVIMGILATAAIPIFSNQGESSRISVHKQNLSVLKKAVDLYVVERGAYTNVEFGTVDRGNQGDTGQAAGVVAPVIKYNYLTAASVKNPWSGTSATQAAYTYQVGLGTGGQYTIRLAQPNAYSVAGAWTSGNSYVTEAGTVTTSTT